MGHFVFELEADATIPAEYAPMRHYRGEEVDASLEMKIAQVLRIQSTDGGLLALSCRRLGCERKRQGLISR